MDELTPQAEVAAVVVTANPPLHTLLLALSAPFGAIALMASPLLIDAIRHTAGI
jgi:hypothetical protein